MTRPSRFAGDYNLKQLKISKLSSPGTPIMDIRGLNLVDELTVTETIESPIIRATAVMRDVVGFHNLLYGSEILTFNVESTHRNQSNADFSVRLMLHTIGDKIRQERTTFYNLEFASPDAFTNEFTRVNRVYKKRRISDIVSSILNEDLQTSEENVIEATSEPVTILSPNWRPFDACAWMCKHAKKSKDRGVGYMFFSNSRDGYVFRSVDSMLKDSVKQPQVQTFYYQPKNLKGGGGDSDQMNIEAIKFPKVTRFMEQMRIGSFAGTALGIDLCDLRKTTVSRYTAREYWNKMDHAENFEFIGLSGSRIEEKYTRQYLIGLPTYLYTDQQAMNGGVASLADTLDNQLYATLRYQSMKHVMCTIVIPGNTTVHAGDCVKIVVPVMDASGKTMPVKDPIYTGKYLVAAVKHIWSPKKLTTELTLCRDSIYENPSSVK
jgi:hypothetical protein